MYRNNESILLVSGKSKCFCHPVEERDPGEL